MSAEYFILICSDGWDSSESTISAFDVAHIRLKHAQWPIYRHTPQKKVLKEGDACFFYVAGNKKHSQCIIAEAKISEVVDSSRLSQDDLYVKLISDIPEKILQLRAIKKYDNPVDIRGLIDSLDFIASKKNWGSYFQGGCKRISKADFKKISSNHSEH